MGKKKGKKTSQPKMITQAVQATAKPSKDEVNAVIKEASRAQDAARVAQAEQHAQKMDEEAKKLQLEQEIQEQQKKISEAVIAGGIQGRLQTKKIASVVPETPVVEPAATVEAPVSEPVATAPAAPPATSAIKPTEVTTRVAKTSVWTDDSWSSLTKSPDDKERFKAYQGGQYSLYSQGVPDLTTANSVQSETLEIDKENEAFFDSLLNDNTQLTSQAATQTTQPTTLASPNSVHQQDSVLSKAGSGLENPSQNHITLDTTNDTESLIPPAIRPEQIQEAIKEEIRLFQQEDNLSLQEISKLPLPVVGDDTVAGIEKPSAPVVPETPVVEPAATVVEPAAPAAPAVPETPASTVQAAATTAPRAQRDFRDSANAVGTAEEAALPSTVGKINTLSPVKVMRYENIPKGRQGTLEKLVELRKHNAVLMGYAVNKEGKQTTDRGAIDPQRTLENAREELSRLNVTLQDMQASFTDALATAVSSPRFLAGAELEQAMQQALEEVEADDTLSWPSLKSEQERNAEELKASTNAPEQKQAALEALKAKVNKLKKALENISTPQDLIRRLEREKVLFVHLAKVQRILQMRQKVGRAPAKNPLPITLQQHSALLQRTEKVKQTLLSGLAALNIAQQGTQPAVIQSSAAEAAPVVTASTNSRVSMLFKRFSQIFQTTINKFRNFFTTKKNEQTVATSKDATPRRPTFIQKEQNNFSPSIEIEMVSLTSKQHSQASAAPEVKPTVKSAAPAAAAEVKPIVKSTASTAEGVLKTSKPRRKAAEAEDIKEVKSQLGTQNIAYQQQREAAKQKLRAWSSEMERTLKEKNLLKSKDSLSTPPDPTPGRPGSGRSGTQSII